MGGVESKEVGEGEEVEADGDSDLACAGSSTLLHAE